MKDFNAKIGINEDNFGLGKRNARGERLIEFASYENMKIADTFFKKKNKRRWTWRSPNDRSKNEIDYFLSDKLENIKDVTAINQVNVGSDHRLAPQEKDSKG